MGFVAATITLFLMMDALGHISSFLTMAEGIPARRHNYVIWREMGIALFAMLLFNFIGEAIFSFLKVSEVSVMLSIGVILFLTALKILYPSKDSPRHHIKKEEPFIVPLAIPLVAGPAVLATIILFAHSETSWLFTTGAILIAWLASVAIFLLAPTLKQFMGTNGLLAFERLSALVLVMIAIQRFMEGVKLFTIINR